MDFSGAEQKSFSKREAGDRFSLSFFFGSCMCFGGQTSTHKVKKHYFQLNLLGSFEPTINNDRRAMAYSTVGTCSVKV